MIEVVVTDVILRAPKDEEAKWLASGRHEAGSSRVILLKSDPGRAFSPFGLVQLKGILSRWRSKIWLCSDQ